MKKLFLILFVLLTIPVSVDGNGLQTNNSINRPLEAAISSTHNYTLTHGTNNQRVKSVYVKPGATTQTKYYVGPYEETVRGGFVQKNYYIHADGGIAAVYTEGHPELGVGLYYFHNDHQGFGRQNYYMSYDEFQSGGYFYTGYRNPLSLWDR
jgi:hypothetical protein